MGPTSGSDAKLFQPSRSQSKITHTRSASLGSRNTSAPFEPCCLRFSAPLVEKTSVKRSKSSTVVVARSIVALLTFPASLHDAEAGLTICRRRVEGHGAISLWLQKEQKPPWREDGFRSSGGGIRTRDLRVMSPAQAEHWSCAQCRNAT